MIFSTEGFLKVSVESWPEQKFEPIPTEFLSDPLTD